MASIEEILHLCRLCLVKDQVNIPIFEDPGDRQIFLKITSCLPVKVSKQDKLPKNICGGCSDKLNSFYEFWSSSANAEKTLLSWLAQQEETEELPVPKPLETLVKYEPELDKTLLEENTKDETEAPPSKRVRRTAAVKARVNISHESEDEDLDTTETYTKMEEESEGTDGEDKDPSYTEMPGNSADDNQAGPSGVGKDGAEAPIDDMDIFGKATFYTKHFSQESRLIDITKIKRAERKSIEQIERKRIYSSPISFKSIFTNKARENQHVDQGEKQEKAEQCNKIFSVDDVKDSNEGMLKKADYHCLTCNVAFSDQMEVKAHVHTQHHCKYFCKPCGQFFSTKGGLIVHAIQDSIDKTTKQFHKCEQCVFTFDDRHQLKRHYVTIHNQFSNHGSKQGTNNVAAHLDNNASNITSNSSNPNTKISVSIFDCEVCYDVFTSQEDLQQHIELHNELESRIVRSTPMLIQNDGERLAVNVERPSNKAKVVNNRKLANQPDHFLSLGVSNEKVEVQSHKQLATTFTNTSVKEKLPDGHDKELEGNTTICIEDDDTQVETGSTNQITYVTSQQVLSDKQEGETDSLTSIYIEDDDDQGITTFANSSVDRNPLPNSVKTLLTNDSHRTSFALLNETNSTNQMTHTSYELIGNSHRQMVGFRNELEKETSIYIEDDEPTGDVAAIEKSSAESSTVLNKTVFSSQITNALTHKLASEFSSCAPICIEDDETEINFHSEPPTTSFAFAPQKALQGQTPLIKPTVSKRPTLIRIENGSNQVIVTVANPHTEPEFGTDFTTSQVMSTVSSPHTKAGLSAAINSIELTNLKTRLASLEGKTNPSPPICIEDDDEPVIVAVNNNHSEGELSGDSSRTESANPRSLSRRTISDKTDYQDLANKITQILKSQISILPKSKLCIENKKKSNVALKCINDNDHKVANSHCVNKRISAKPSTKTQNKKKEKHKNETPTLIGKNDHQIANPNIKGDPRNNYICLFTPSITTEEQGQSSTSTVLPSNSGYFFINSNNIQPNNPIMNQASPAAGPVLLNMPRSDPPQTYYVVLQGNQLFETNETQSEELVASNLTQATPDLATSSLPESGNKTNMVMPVITSYGTVPPSSPTLTFPENSIKPKSMTLPVITSYGTVPPTSAETNSVNKVIVMPLINSYGNVPPNLSTRTERKF